MVAISVQAQPKDAASWLALARDAEAAGFDSLLAPDHPGTAASPFVALAAAAAVTDRIGLGSYVSQAGIREPLLLVSDVATLDVVSRGRARLGLGMGHTPSEWEMVGRSKPDVAGRVRRFLAVAQACEAMLSGAEVSIDSDSVRVSGARLDGPALVQERVPFTIGGGNSTLLRWAGQHADIVGLSGLGRTLSDGHHHEVRFSATDIDRQVELIEQGAAHRSRGPAREALVQRMEISDDAGAAAHRLAEQYQTTEADILSSPYVLLGTEREIVNSMAEHEKRWGIRRYVVREPDIAAGTQLIKVLAGE